MLSDTQKLHSKVESELLEEFGVHLPPEEITDRYAGVRTRDFFDELLNKQDIPYNLDVLMNRKWQQMELLAKDSVEAIEGSVELVERLHSENYPLSVASASNYNYVQQVLCTLNIAGKFDVVIGGDMVSQGKPHPESFLAAASQLGIAPEECLVFEDGKSGMVAAKAANMYCVGLVRERGIQYPTPNQVFSLLEVTNDYIFQLIK